jgi:hypothetical protein
MLFLKANFFVVAIVPLAYAYVFGIKSRRHAMFLLCGFMVVFFAMSWYLHWNLGPFLADLKIAAGARASQNRKLLAALIRIPSRNFIPIASIASLSLIGQALPAAGNKKNFPCLHRSVLWLMMVLACDFVLASSNTQGSGLPLCLIASLLLVDQLIRYMPKQQGQLEWVLPACLFVVVIATVLPTVTDLVNAWETQMVIRVGGGTKGVHIDAPRMATLGFKDNIDAIWGPSLEDGQLMTSQIDDGLALLRAHTDSRERVACMCFANPFNYALERQPARGGAPFFDYGFSLTETFAPTADRILGDAEVVLYPKGEDSALTFATLMRICKPILTRNYKYVGESERWVLLRRMT